MADKKVASAIDTQHGGLMIGYYDGLGCACHQDIFFIGGCRSLRGRYRNQNWQKNENFMFASMFSAAVWFVCEVFGAY